LTELTADDELEETELDLLDDELVLTELDLLDDELVLTELDLLEDELEAAELALDDDPPELTSPVTSILSISIPLDVASDAVILNLIVPAGRVKLFDAEVQLAFELNDFVVAEPPFTVISYDAVTAEV
jgi:hypothetical protein